MTSRVLTVHDLLLVAFNGRVFALDRATGEQVWRWQSDRRSFITILPEEDAIFVCCDGYTWALNPGDGSELWHQPFKGEGTGIPSLGAIRAPMNSSSPAAAEFARQQAAKANAS